MSWDTKIDGVLVTHRSKTKEWDCVVIGASGALREKPKLREGLVYFKQKSASGHVRIGRLLADFFDSSMISIKRRRARA